MECISLLGNFPPKENIIVDGDYFCIEFVRFFEMTLMGMIIVDMLLFGLVFIVLRGRDVLIED